jgi:hypothetical protein
MRPGTLGRLVAVLAASLLQGGAPEERSARVPEAYRGPTTPAVPVLEPDPAVRSIETAPGRRMRGDVARQQ